MVPLLLLAAASTTMRIGGITHNATRSAAAAAWTPVKICFDLPSTSTTGAVGVTVAVVDLENPDWIITHLTYAQPFNVTEGEQQQGCVGWDGLDENFWPVPPGTYGLKGIVMPVTHWEVDNKHHALVPNYVGSVSPVPPTRNNTATQQQLLVQGDAVGQSFSSIGISANFPGRPDHANLYHSYLENAFNNYLLNISMPHGGQQRVWRWHDAGVGGGQKTATNGHSVWSWTHQLAGNSLYRGDIGDENLAVWGSCNASGFFSFPGLNCLPAGTVVLDMEVVPGAGVPGNNSSPATAVWVLTTNANTGSSSVLTAYDGYAGDAAVLHCTALAPASPGAVATAMAVRNGVIHVLSNDTTVRKIALDPKSGLPSGRELPGVNLTQVLNQTLARLSQGGGTTGPIAVDAQGSLFVYIKQTSRIEAVNSSGLSPGAGECGSGTCGKGVGNADSSGAITATPAGVIAMTTWVDGAGHSKLVVLEEGGARRYMQFEYGNASLPTPQAKSGQLEQVWNDIAAGSNSGWVFDPETSDYGWVTQTSASPDPTIPSTHRWGDLVKVATNATDGDWQVVEVFAGVGCNFLLSPDERVPSSFRGGGQPALVVRNGIRYLVYQNAYKTVLKWNETRRTWVPSAGLVLSFYNDTRAHGAFPGVIPFIWHDANNDGAWRLTNEGGPDWSELSIFRGFEATDGGRWTFLADLVQDDLSFVGITKLGYWHWEVAGWDAHDNPIYAEMVSPLLNDTVMAARAAYNASTMPTPCAKCAGLPATHGGNEVGSSMGDHATGRFTDAAHDNIVVAEGKTGSMYLKSGCFSADSCPQWKLAWYRKNTSGDWVNRWRVGRTPIAADDGAGQFAGLKSNPGAGDGVEPMWVNPVIGNLVSVMDGMRSGILVYTTDGLYVDTLFVAGAGAAGYRPGFTWGSATVYNAGGENFAYGQVYMDEASGKVMVAFGKTTMLGFEVDGWSGKGAAVEPLVFKGGPTVHLQQSNVAEPPGIAGQIRGYPPKGSELAVARARAQPALDGSLGGWEDATAAAFGIDGLNVDQAAQIEARVLHDADSIYVHFSINQNLTGWSFPLVDIDPVNRMFIHGRGSTTCSIYIQGNMSIPWDPNKNPPPFGRPGDSRFVFGIGKGAGGEAQMAVLGVYPYWDPKFGKATPTTYAVAWHNVTFANVGELQGIKKGFILSKDGFSATMAAAIPKSAVPWLPDPITSGITRGDFSCNVMGFQKDWFVNEDLQASQITWDEPTEAELYPGSWGNFTFK